MVTLSGQLHNYEMSIYQNNNQPWNILYHKLIFFPTTIRSKWWQTLPDLWHSLMCWVISCLFLHNTEQKGHKDVSGTWSISSTTGQWYTNDSMSIAKSFSLLPPLRAFDKFTSESIFLFFLFFFSLLSKYLVSGIWHFLISCCFLHVVLFAALGWEATLPVVKLSADFSPNSWTRLLSLSLTLPVTLTSSSEDTSSESDLYNSSL